MSRFIRTVSVLLLLILSAACQSTQNGAALEVSPSNPQIFRVGGEVYTVTDYTRRLEQEISAGIENLLAQGQTVAQIEELASQSNVRGQIFDQMLQDALLLQYARSHGIGVDPAAVDSAVAAQSGPGAPSSEQRISQARNQLVLEVLARNTRADMFRARQIQVASEAEADQLLAELAAGADFAALAEQHSQDSASAEQGGDLGWTPRGDLPPELDTAGFELALNTPSKLESPLGWHVFEVIERQAGETAAEKRPFDSFERLQQSQSGQQFYQETFLPWYEQLRQEAVASGDLVIAEGFDPNSVPLPFPEQ